MNKKQYGIYFTVTDKEKRRMTVIFQPKICFFNTIACGVTCFNCFQIFNRTSAIWMNGWKHNINIIFNK